jgi:hypothetical protein
MTSRGPLACLLVLALTLSVTHAFDGDDGEMEKKDDGTTSAACRMWSKLENKTLPLQDQGHANCTTNEECTGFTCKGIYQGKELSFGMRVLPCQATPGIEIYGYAPQINSKNFSHVFNHKELYDVPGELLNMTMMQPNVLHLPPKTVDGEALIQGKLEVTLERNPDNKTMTMGLTAKGCIQGKCIFSSPVFNHTEIPVPQCTNSVSGGGSPIKVNSVCSINELNVCGAHQACVQEEEEGEMGLCECLGGYALQDDGSCLSRHDDDLAAAEKKRTSNRQPKSHDPDRGAPIVSDGDEESSGSGAVVALISILVVVVIVGVGAFLIFRTRLAPRLRARLTNTPYGDIVGGLAGARRHSESTQNVIA